MTLDQWDSFLSDEEEKRKRQNIMLDDFLVPVKKNLWRMFLENIKGLI